MKEKIELEDCFDNEGNFNIFLKIHIVRYAEEMDLTIHDVINVLKKTGINIKTWCYFSFNGYASFKFKMDYLKNNVVKI